MTKIRQWFTDRPYAVAGFIFLGLAIIGVRLLGWWQDELKLLLLLYVLAILGIRLDEISRKLGTLESAAAPDIPETGTILDKLDEIAHSLKVLNHRLAKLTAVRQVTTRPPAVKKNPQQKLPTENSAPDN